MLSAYRRPKDVDWPFSSVTTAGTAAALAWQTQMASNTPTRSSFMAGPWSEEGPTPVFRVAGQRRAVWACRSGSVRYLRRVQTLHRCGLDGNKIILHNFSSSNKYMEKKLDSIK